MRPYGIPSKIFEVITMLYSNSSANVICGNKLTDRFGVKTGVKQGCVLSPFLFLLGIDWIVRQATDVTRRGIGLTLFMNLEDLYFAGDIVLLSQRKTGMQAKTTVQAEKAQSIGLKVSKKKTKHMRVKAKSEEPIKLYDENIVDVDDLTYLSSKMSRD